MSPRSRLGQSERPGWNLAPDQGGSLGSGNSIETRAGIAGVNSRGYVIRAEPPSVAAALWELWESRALLYIFLWRDVRVRYRHTFLGAAWNILQPLGMMAVYTFVF